MQVVSKLVKMQLKIATIEREGDQLIVISDPQTSLPAKVYLAPEDIAGVLKATLRWSILSYLLSFPYILYKSKRTAAKGKN